MSVGTFKTSINWGISGQVGTLAVTVYDDDGGILNARTTSGITEVPADSGLYDVNILNFDDSKSGRIVYDDGLGAYEEQRFSAATSGATDAATVTVTRRLPFVLRTGNPSALTDATGTPLLTDPSGTFGIRRADTGTVLVAAGQSYTRAGVGTYYYETDADGPLEYGVTYVHPLTGNTESFVLTSNPQGNHYSTVAKMRLKLGLTNEQAYAAGSSADLENTGTAAVIDAEEEEALTESDDRVNLKIIGAGGEVPLPDEISSNTTIMRQIVRAATLYAAGYLLKLREDQRNAGQTSTASELTAGDKLIAEGDAIMDTLAGAGSLTVDTSDDATSMGEVGSAGATVDANGCPLPLTTCGPYGSYPYYGVRILN